LKLGAHAFLTQTFGLVCHTQELWLSDNQIGDGGVSALASACAMGALPALISLQLAGNKIGNEGMIKFSEACASGALPSLWRLDLENNTIGDVGLSAFASACATGAMAQLQARSLPTALSASPETWHAHSPDSDVLFRVQYAEALAQR
jgi:hypothetical protein